MLLLAFYVPLAAKENVKKAIFAAGAGKIGNYEFCSFEYQGQGQFCPLKGSRPFLGRVDQLEIVEEVKVEVVCEEAVITEVIAALKSSHPYETPAYHVIKALNY